MTNLATKLFGLPEEIAIGNPCTAHLYRWMIFANNHFQVCLEHTIGDEGSREVPQYPLQFVSVGVAHEIVAGRATWMVLIEKKSNTVKNAKYD
jgi:hypothetical protein